MTIQIFVQLMGVTRNRIEPVKQGMVLPESGQNYTLAIILALALVVSLAVAAFILLRTTSQQTINDPVKLFNELCRGHGLSRSQRNALIDLASKRKLTDPSLVLLDSSYWVLDPNTDQELCQPQPRNRLVMVQRLLFNSDTPAVQSKLSS